MDIETAEALEALRIDLRQVESTLSARIDRSEASLRSEIAELRRHTLILNESVRDDIRIVAEAVAVLTTNVAVLTTNVGALTVKVDALSRR